MFADYVRFENHTSNELLNIAYREDNTLAEVIYDKAYKEGYDKCNIDNIPVETDFPEPSDSEKFDNIIYLKNLEASEWGSSRKGLWVIPRFNEDTNIYHNDVRIRHLGSNAYVIEFGLEAYGEIGFSEKSFDGLKYAKIRAIELAIKFVIEGRLNS